MKNNCLICGKEFYARPSEVAKGNGKFCSMPCYAKHHGSTPWIKQGKLITSGIEKCCPICGVSFRTSRLKGRERIFCSRACALKGRGVEKTCPQCGKVFRVPRSNASRYTSCSFACKTYNVPRPRVASTCQRCGKEFSGLNAKYCSEACYRPPVFYTCLTCDKISRHRNPGSNDGRPKRFCNISCYRKYTGETKPETNVRLSLIALDIPFTQEYHVGRYSIDFFLSQHNVALEVDGAYWHKEIIARDAKRDSFITEQGIRVIRISSAPFEAKFSPEMIETLRGNLAAISL